MKRQDPWIRCCKSHHRAKPQRTAEQAPQGRKALMCVFSCPHADRHPQCSVEGISLAVSRRERRCMAGVISGSITSYLPGGMRATGPLSTLLGLSATPVGWQTPSKGTKQGPDSVVPHYPGRRAGLSSLRRTPGLEPPCRPAPAKKQRWVPTYIQGSASRDQGPRPLPIDSSTLEHPRWVAITRWRAGDAQDILPSSGLARRLTMAN